MLWWISDTHGSGVLRKEYKITTLFQNSVLVFPLKDAYLVLTKLTSVERTCSTGVDSWSTAMGSGT